MLKEGRSHPRPGAQEAPSPAPEPPSPSAPPAPLRTASWWRRAAATIVDHWLLGQLLPRALESAIVGRRKGLGLLARGGATAICLLYHVGAHLIWGGQSVGKRLFRLQVVRCGKQQAASPPPAPPHVRSPSPPSFACVVKRVPLA